MRKSLTSMLNDLGNYLRKVDDRYAEGVRNVVMPSSRGDGGPLNTARSYAGAVMGAPLRIDNELNDPTTINQILKYAVPATSATVRYVLPAAGVTMAGQALGDLVNRIYDDEL